MTKKNKTSKQKIEYHIEHKSKLLLLLIVKILLVFIISVFVLGGIYESITSKEVDKVPFLGDLPLIGGLFRHTLDSKEKNELLIFVTPKVLKDTLEL